MFYTIYTSIFNHIPNILDLYSLLIRVFTLFHRKHFKMYTKINEIRMNNSIVYLKSTKLQIYKQSMDNSKLITSEIHVFDN